MLTYLIEQQRGLVWDGWMQEANESIRAQCPGTSMDWIDVLFAQSGNYRPIDRPVEFRRELYDQFQELLSIESTEELVMIRKLARSVIRYLETTE